jgi:hypothetical protein
VLFSYALRFSRKEAAGGAWIVVGWQ